MGSLASVALERVGFMSVGGGVLRGVIPAVKQFKKLILHERGDLLHKGGVWLEARLGADISARARGTAAEILGWSAEKFVHRTVQDSEGLGGILMLEMQFANVTEIVSGVAERMKSAETLGKQAAKNLVAYAQSDAVLGSHLADQVLLPMALGAGGVVSVHGLSEHTLSSMDLIPRFLDVKFTTTSLTRGAVLIEV